ncbi:hypothetical protein EON83_21350 [bacterium]|nr:MAG: hypothetical protein EON83_21350 [bacterium]
MQPQRALEILSRAREQNALVCAYPSSYSSKFSAGWVEAVSSEGVVLRSLTPNGRPDGWLWRPYDQIARLDMGGLYEERLAFLAQMREARWKEGFLPAITPEADLVWELFVASQKHDLAVHIDIGSDEPIQGFVQDVTAEWVTLDKIAFSGRFDGQATISTEDIEKILIEEQDLQDLQMLARRHGRGAGQWR